MGIPRWTYGRSERQRGACRPGRRRVSSGEALPGFPKKSGMRYRRTRWYYAEASVIRPVLRSMKAGLIYTLFREDDTFCRLPGSQRISLPYADETHGFDAKVCLDADEVDTRSGRCGQRSRVSARLLFGVDQRLDFASEHVKYRCDHG